MKRLMLGAAAIIALLFLLASVYLGLSSVTKYKIDKSETLKPLSSAKSNAPHYAFGYQADVKYTEAREACAAQYPQKRAMWGDLHIHTALSADAYPDGTRSYPEDVYRFAKGEAIDLPSPEGHPQRRLRLERPLDFAAVTDHAETFGEGYICTQKGRFPGYDSKPCEIYRAGGEKGVREFMSMNSIVFPKRKAEVCGTDGADCAEAESIVWQRVIDAAQQAYDRTKDCSFTSFIGYEYTRAPNANHMHRNTIFRNADVPARPFHHLSHPLTHQLLGAFETQCRAGLENCDVISIPHNSNISSGNAFNPKDLDGFSMATQQSYQSYRNAYDRLAEIVQHKGTSECINGASDVLGDIDELCDIEAVRAFGKQEKAAKTTGYTLFMTNTDSPECSETHFDPKDNLYKGGCLSSRDFARGALLEGMKTARRTDNDTPAANPYEFGFIGSTDTHISASGYVDEDSWSGHIAYESELEERLGEASLGRFNRLVSNPGGLAGVYAVENSRDAIFQSMKRREAFATSGPRIEPRFFAGRFDADICARDDWLEQAYKNGTPMGSKLGRQSTPFQFLAQASADPLSLPLEKLQIIKGWIGPEGHKHSKVIDLIGGSIEPAANTHGAAQLCTVFEDVDYNPEQPSYYYLRTAEALRPRWSEAQCAALPDAERPESCNNNAPETIREIAWSSPIWFTPDYQRDLPADLEGHKH